jgi:hypothetical protein
MMKLKCDFEEGERIPCEYTCDGENVNPEIEISDVPSNAKSLVLIVDDIDSPSGTFGHWILFNIPVNIRKISRDSVPVGAIEGKNDFGENMYGGPCPHKGNHTYRFRVYALNEVLKLGKECSHEDIEEELKGKIVDHAIVTGTYSREK